MPKIENCGISVAENNLGRFSKDRAECRQFSPIPECPDGRRGSVRIFPTGSKRCDSAADCQNGSENRQPLMQYFGFIP